MTDPAPAYVHRILDAYLTGELIDFTGLTIPLDVEQRLADHGLPHVRARRELVGDPRTLEHPAKGWVRPEDPPVYCDACDRLIYYWELHHLDPVGWGGSDSRLLVDRQVVWVRIDGDCHSTAHMILDTAKQQGQWPELWLNGYDPPIPHAIVEVARRGWQLDQKRLQQTPAETT